MVQYTYTKQVNPSRLTEEIKAAGLTDIHHIDTSGLTVLVFFNEALTAEQKTLLDTRIAAHAPINQSEVVEKIIDDAIAFGISCTREFVKENVMLGITQRGLTGHVRKALREVKDAMDTGSVYDVITEIRKLNPDDFDAVILTPARLLAFRNKVEKYLQVPLATSWDEEETWL